MVEILLISIINLFDWSKASTPIKGLQKMVWIPNKVILSCDLQFVYAYAKKEHKK